MLLNSTDSFKSVSTCHQLVQTKPPLISSPELLNHLCMFMFSEIFHFNLNFESIVFFILSKIIDTFSPHSTHMNTNIPIYVLT